MTAASLYAAVPARVSWLTSFVTFGGSLPVLMKAWAMVRKVELDAAGERRKVEVTAEGAMSTALMERVAKLEGAVEAERRMCDERISRIEDRHDAAMVALEEQLQVSRHDRNNLKACFDALLMLMRQHPNKVTEKIAAVTELRAKGEETLAIEKAAIPITRGVRR